MHVLSVNCGSSSVKIELFETSSSTSLRKQSIDLKKGDALESQLSDIFRSYSNEKIDALGHRVVHGGANIFESQRVNAELERVIESCIPLAPLHNPANLAGIRIAQQHFPDCPHVAVFDTAFHARMPRRSKSYAIDKATVESMGLRKFGFHGTSHRYVAHQAAMFMERPLEELRLVSCHLGNGASACAVEFGHSTDTSMGMTPLEGLVMGTRCGDVDPGAVLAMVRTLGVDETETLLNHQSGLKGLSGISHDLRDVQRQAEEGHDDARLALSVFGHRVRKYIGSYAASMAGLDAVIMTGGIGENSASMRRRILQRFEFLGLTLDDDKNNDASTKDAPRVSEISASRSRVKALVIQTNEALMIARDTATIVNRSKQSGRRDKKIPIAVSARHVHLNRETMDTLFGKGAELTVYKEISQPGQYASEQRVNLIGPRGEIKNVRILGPLRSKNQIEISRTDEFKLGVDAPIRNSGKTEGSAPIVVEGPKGRIQLSEGLICARRHVHMTPDDAEFFGVSDRDEVEIAVTGGPRDLTFGDVLVRVKDSYRLEMHIDTDEANAAELSSGTQGDLVYETPKGEVSANILSSRLKARQS